MSLSEFEEWLRKEIDDSEECLLKSTEGDDEWEQGYSCACRLILAEVKKLKCG